MKLHIPGLHGENRNGSDQLEGVFLVRVDRAFYRWHPTRPFYLLRFAILEPKEHCGHSLSGRIYCTSKALCNEECIVTQTLPAGSPPVRHFEDFLLGIKGAGRSDAINLSVALEAPGAQFRRHRLQGHAPLLRTLQADLLMHWIGSDLLPMIIGAALALACGLVANLLVRMITVRLKSLPTVAATVADGAGVVSRCQLLRTAWRPIRVRAASLALPRPHDYAVQSGLQNQQIIQLRIGIGGCWAAQLRVTIHSALHSLCFRKHKLWRLSWFLRDFGYSTDLLGRDELDEKALLGLQGIVRVSHTVRNGHSFLNFDGFAPAADWEELAPAANREVTNDL